MVEGPSNFWRLINAYYDTYTSPESVNDFMLNMHVRASILIFRKLLTSPGSEPQDTQDMAAFFASMQRQERRQGVPVSCRSADTYKLIRYQRNRIALL